MTNTFLPIRVAFPVIASVLYGPSSRIIPDHINVESFIDYIGLHESSILTKAITVSEAGKDFSQDLKGNLIALLSRFDCMVVPIQQRMLVV